MGAIEINRIWAMPNKNTFQIKPVNDLINKYNKGNLYSIDPFANKSTLAWITNDIDPQYSTTFHKDALDFLKTFKDDCVDLVLYDPPFSPRQVSECYKKMNMTVNKETTQASYWSKQKNEIARIIKPNGLCISCGWNSNGIGKTRGFEIIEILLVAHGGNHNDTIITVERKTDGL